VVNDDADALLPGLGAAGSLRNSQCTVSWGSSAVAASGNNIMLSLSFDFSLGFGPPLVLYLAARDLTDTSNTGWQALGTWQP
jgi:hypothetical protein